MTSAVPGSVMLRVADGWMNRKVPTHTTISTTVATAGRWVGFSSRMGSTSGPVYTSGRPERA